MRLREISPLFELFNANPATIRKVTDRKILGDFEVAGNIYEILFFCSNPKSGQWAVTFKPKGAQGWDAMYGDLGTAKNAALKVYAVATATIIDFLKTQQPPRLFMMGDTENGRDVLYGRMIKKVAGQLSAAGYDVQAEEDGGFLFVRRSTSTAS